MLENVDFDSSFTEKRNHATEIAAEKIRAGEDLIVAVGGDGTFNEVLNGFFNDGMIINDQCVLGLISSGTGSATIRTLGHSADLKSQMKIILEGTTNKIDAGRATFVDFDGNRATRFFLNVADAGLGGDVVDRVNRTTKILGGKFSFLLGSVKGVLHHQPVRTTIIFDDDETSKFECPLNLIAAGNGRYFGGGMMICPNAVNDDGLFDVVSICGAGRLRLLTRMNMIYRGEHLEMKEVTEHPRCRKLKIMSEKPVFLDLDGEQVGTTDMELELLPGILQVKTVSQQSAQNQQS